MKIVLKRTDEQVELIKALASKNREVAYDAQVALAEFIGPVLAEVINNAPTVSNLFTSLQFNAEDNPSIPLDLYYDVFDEDYIKVYSKGPDLTSNPAAGDGSGLTAPDSVRNQVFSQAGLPEFFGVSIMEILELGDGKKFNTIFDTVAGSTSYDGHYATGGSAGAFNGASEQIVVGLDRSRDSLIRAVAVDSDTGSEFTLQADDQYTLRQNKIGYFGALEEGRMVLDNRALVGLIV